MDARSGVRAVRNGLRGLRRGLFTGMRRGLFTSRQPGDPVQRRPDRTSRRFADRSPDRLMKRQSDRTSRRIVRGLRAVFDAVSPLGWGTLLTGLAALCAYPRLGWHELLAYAATTLTLSAAALVMALGNTSFEAALDVPRRRVAVGDTVRLTVEVRNPGRLPTVAAHGELPVGGERERFPVPPLAPGGVRSFDVEFRALSRAVLSVGPLVVRKGDPFGLMRRERRLGGRVDLFVHPATVPLRAFDAGLVRDLEGGPSGVVVDDDLDFHGLRAYEPGDDVRHAHWLSSARTGTLMVRQYESTRRTDTALALAVDPREYAGAEEFELAVSVYASIGVRCLSQDRPLTAYMGDGVCVPSSVTDLLDRCSAIRPDRGVSANLVEAVTRHGAEVSCCLLTVGSLRGTDAIRRMVLALPRGTSVVVLQVCAGAPRAVRRFPEFALATVGALDDLPPLMGVLA